MRSYDLPSVILRLSRDRADGLTLYGGNSTGPFGVGTAIPLGDNDTVAVTLSAEQAALLISELSEQLAESLHAFEDDYLS